MSVYYHSIFPVDYNMFDRYGPLCFLNNGPAQAHVQTDTIVPLVCIFLLFLSVFSWPLMFFLFPFGELNKRNCFRMVITCIDTRLLIFLKINTPSFIFGSA